MTYDESLQGFVPSEVPENVYEADKFRPRFQPGQRVKFLFKLEQDPAKQVTLSPDGKVVRVQYQAQAIATITKDGEQPVRPQGNGEQPTIRFQQVDSRQFTKDDGTVVPSSLHRFFRALVGRDAAKLTGTDPRLIVTKLRELDGRETFEAGIGWKFYDADSQTDYSTAHRKAKEFTKQDGTVGRVEPWPVVDGVPAEAVNGEYPHDFVQTFIEKKVVRETVTA